MNASRLSLLISLIFLLVLLPVAAYGAAGAYPPSATTPTDQGRNGPPPVEQALVPEGVFAIQLVEALKMGPARDEAQAEAQLSAIGIEPPNGWIAGYPVTPPVMGEIEKDVAAAAEGGKLRMGKAEALKALGDLKARLGLNVDPAPQSEAIAAQQVSGRGSGSTVIYKYIDRSGVIHFTNHYESTPQAYRDRVVEMIRETVQPPPAAESPTQEMQPPTEGSIPSPGPEVVNNYYYDYGPPVVTYYAPPPSYGYLYSWVPYPFWGSGFYFSGFFILHNFHRHVSHHGKPFVCSNHVVSHKGGFVVNPHTHRLQDSKMVSRGSSPHVFNSPGVQSSARTIFWQSQNRRSPANAAAQPRMAPPAQNPGMSRFQAPPRPTRGGDLPGVRGGPAQLKTLPQLDFKPPLARPLSNGRGIARLSRPGLLPGVLDPVRGGFPARPLQAEGLSPPLLLGQPGHCRRQLAKHRLTAHPHPAAEALSGEVIRAAGASTPGADLSGAVSAGAAGKSTSKM